MKNVRDYNKLIPPSNPKFPWIPEKWQVLCYYCCEPIELQKAYAFYRQRTFKVWIHCNGEWLCDPTKIRSSDEIDEPRCHCGAQDSDSHMGICSARGTPKAHAMSMSDKENEIEKMKAWLISKKEPANG